MCGDVLAELAIDDAGVQRDLEALERDHWLHRLGVSPLFVGDPVFRPDRSDVADVMDVAGVLAVDFVSKPAGRGYRQSIAARRPLIADPRCRQSAPRRLKRGAVSQSTFFPPAVRWEPCDRMPRKRPIVHTWRRRSWCECTSRNVRNFPSAFWSLNRRGDAGGPSGGRQLPGPSRFAGR